MHAPHQKPKTLALFDFDGTLCNKDSFTGFIFYSLPKRHIVRQGIKILPWIQGYYLKLYPAHAMRPRLYAAMFSQANHEQVLNQAAQYAEHLMAELNPSLYEQLQQHQKRGHEVVLVSASVDLYLKPVAEKLGVKLICTETAANDQILTGLYQTLDCSGEQKKIRVLEQFNLQDYEQVYAYGNSDEDLAMFELATHHFMNGQDKCLPELD
ncbi:MULTISPECIES: HAD-IB family hydrolase [unclassified Acinetobacter]|uniref:HAD-IB family hydrolase n=1 Tax=unclassified Acinetobacter TaxID=196816 RepID=UPI0015D30E1C|nr:MULTISPECIES: HAD-IB family hydrolase [unclassified Acinetobacter]